MNSDPGAGVNALFFIPFQRGTSATLHDPLRDEARHCRLATIAQRTRHAPSTTLLPSFESSHVSCSWNCMLAGRPAGCTTRQPLPAERAGSHLLPMPHRQAATGAPCGTRTVWPRHMHEPVNYSYHTVAKACAASVPQPLSPPEPHRTQRRKAATRISVRQPPQRGSPVMRNRRTSPPTGP